MSASSAVCTIFVNHSEKLFFLEILNVTNVESSFNGDSVLDTFLVDFFDFFFAIIGHQNHLLGILNLTK
jgi:hypothetical protein